MNAILISVPCGNRSHRAWPCNEHLLQLTSTHWINETGRRFIQYRDSNRLKVSSGTGKLSTVRIQCFQSTDLIKRTMCWGLIALIDGEKHSCCPDSINEIKWMHYVFDRAFELCCSAETMSALHCMHICTLMWFCTELVLFSQLCILQIQFICTKTRPIATSW